LARASPRASRFHISIKQLLFTPGGQWQQAVALRSAPHCLTWLGRSCSIRSSEGQAVSGGNLNPAMVSTTLSIVAAVGFLALALISRRLGYQEVSSWTICIWAFLLGFSALAAVLYGKSRSSVAVKPTKGEPGRDLSTKEAPDVCSSGAAPASTGTMPCPSASDMLPRASVHDDVLPPSETGGYGSAPTATGWIAEGADLHGLLPDGSTLAFPEIDTKRTAGELAAAPSMDTSETMDLRALRKSTSPPPPPPPPTETMPHEAASS